MNVQEKLHILADAAKYDASCSSSGGKRRRPEKGIGNTEGMGICHSYTPDGRCVSLLKILLTNYCVYDCLFCVNRSSSDTPRARFTVEEVVSLTLEFYRRNYIEGLFLSSGIIQSPDYTMEQLVGVARSLRIDNRFGGYIHLKTIPNASKELIAAAGRFADRLSINIELPTQSDLNVMAPAKEHRIIESAMAEIKDLSQENPSAGRPIKIQRKRRDFAPAGQSTQMIVGATPSTDAVILATSAKLYTQHQLRRVYYSAFSPIPYSAPGVPAKAPPLIREHRLYQADWLFRFYGFGHSELVTEADQNLSLEMDPKLAWALRNRHVFPIDINKASRNLLLRVPGLGVRNVNRIVQARRFSVLRVEDLIRLKVPYNKVKYFVTAAGANEAMRFIDSTRLSQLVVPSQSRQLSLFSAETVSVVTGEL